MRAKHWPFSRSFVAVGITLGLLGLLGLLGAVAVVAPRLSESDETSTTDAVEDSAKGRPDAPGQLKKCRPGSPKGKDETSTRCPRVEATVNDDGKSAIEVSPVVSSSTTVAADVIVTAPNAPMASTTTKAKTQDPTSEPAPNAPASSAAPASAAPAVAAPTAAPTTVAAATAAPTTVAAATAAPTAVAAATVAPMVKAPAPTVAPTTRAPTTTASAPVPTKLLTPGGIDRVVDLVSGNDSNDGSPGSPWRSLSQAAGAAKPGDVVAIRSGVYSEGLDVKVSGSPGKRIVFTSHPANTSRPVLRGKCVSITSQSHIEVRGLRIEHCDQVGDHSRRGVEVVGAPGGSVVKDIVIADNDIYHTKSSAISVWGVRWLQNPGDFKRIDGIVIDGNTIQRANEGGYNEQITVANGVINFEISNNTLRNSTEFGNGGEGIDVKEGVSYGSIHHNTIHDIARRAIYIDGGGRSAYVAPTHHIDVYGNVAYNVVNGLAIMSEAGGDVHDIRVFNNLFYDIEFDCAFIYDHPNAASNPGQMYNIEFVNNTFWRCDRNGLDLNSANTRNIVVKNNIVDVFKDRALAGAASAQNNIDSGDPKFVGTTNFRLQSGSPAIDTGVASGAPSVDIAGVPRPKGSGYNIGAYE